MKGEKRHSWVWARGLAFLLRLRKPYRTCVKCGARLRREEIGPRGGKVYTFKGATNSGFAVVKALPPCPVGRAPSPSQRVQRVAMPTQLELETIDKELK
jgi:hypothetical protein